MCNALGKLFGTDGVRGITNEQLSPILALKLGMAIGSFFGYNSKILVGRDGRAGGDMLVHAVIAGLQSAGAKVYYAGYTPTPALQYVVKIEDFDGGVVVTASHNPPEYNGIKVVGPLGIEIDRDKEKEIEEIFFEERFRRASWRLLVSDVSPYPGVVDKYVRGILGLVDKALIRKKRYRVVVDCANNVGSLATPKLLRELGVSVYTLNCDVNPIPSREPEPTPSTLRELSAIVKTVSADLGVGHDGDADRVIIVDDNGEVWWGDRTAALLSAYIGENKLKKAPRRVFTAVSSSTLVEEYLANYGIEVRWTPVGSVHISYSLLREGGIAGFEENGGFMYPPHQLVRDGAMTVALFLEYMAVENKSSSTLYSMLPRYYAIKTKIPMPRDLALKVVDSVKSHYTGLGYRVITIDGVKVFGEDWWVLVRPSGTEPVLRIMAEARSEEKAKTVVEKITQLIRRDKER